MRTVAQGVTWAKSPSARYRDGKSWAGWCLSYVYRFLDASGASRDTAYLAYKASGPIISKDPGKAPKGAIHWWSDSGAGHVAVSLGEGIAAMASGGVTTSWGVAQGSVSIAHYNATHGGLKYLGWTYDFIGHRNPDVQAHLDAIDAKKKAEADAQHAAAAAAQKAKAAADLAAAKKAADLAEQKAAAEKALEAAADAAEPRPEVASLIPLVREHGHDEVYLLVGLKRRHVTKPQYQVFRLLGASALVVPEGSLASFEVSA